MNREYSVSTGYKIFYVLCAAAIVCFGIFLASVPQKNGPAFIIIPLVVVAVGVLIMINVLRARIIVTDNSIIRINLLKTKEILFADVKGFRVDDKIIRFEAISPQSPKFSIARYSDFGQIEEFVSWLNLTFVNLNQVEYQQELEQIMADNELGTTEADRKAKLDGARNLALGYNFGGIALFIVGILLREVSWIDFLLLVYTLLGILVMVMSKGLVKFYAKRASPYFHIFLGLNFCATALLIKSVFGFEIVSFEHVWLPFIAMALLFGFAVKRADGIKKAAIEKGSVILIVLDALFMGYSGTMQINCRPDRSTEQVYHAVVVDRYINHNKGTHPYLRIGTWGPITQTKEIQVSMDFYNKSPIGSAVTVHLKKGVLNIPWYRISE